jgi:hypothetical protein
MGSNNIGTSEHQASAGSRQFPTWAILVLLFSLAACHPQQASSSDEVTVHALGDDTSNPAGVSGLNYSPYYIAGFSITDAEGRTGGGSNIDPSKGDGEPPGESGEMCCVIVPSKWRPGMSVTVQWERDSRPDDKDRSGDQWLKAVAKVPPYGTTQYDFWVQFLDGDRIRVRVDDGNPIEKPSERDPYIAQGVLDAEANQAMQAGRERDLRAMEENIQLTRTQLAQIHQPMPAQRPGDPYAITEKDYEEIQANQEQDLKKLLKAQQEDLQEFHETYPQIQAQPNPQGDKQ